MESREIPPGRLHGVNSPFNQDHLGKLVESMKREGWVGRRLLVEEVRDGDICRFFAWTGSHRIEAAKRAGLAAVPCQVMTHAECDQAFSAAGYEKYGFDSWRGAVTSAEGRLDKHRLRGLEKAALHQAAAMLREELGATDGHGA